MLLPLFVAAQEWKTCPIAWNGTIEPDSALDFSFLNHTPAGKYGFLKRVGDRFEFEKRPGEAVRFWGTNFAIHGPFPDKSLAPGIARTMAAQGVNMVRLHLYSTVPALLQSPDGGFKPDMLDKMFFLISELKKNGVYIYMDINDGLCYDWLLNREPTVSRQERLKAYSLYDPELKKSTKRFAELLFTMTNPYTGMSMAEDPAIAVYELVNEHSMLTTWYNWHDALMRDSKFLQAEEQKKYVNQLTGLWHEFLKKHGRPAEALPKHLNSSELSRRFGAELDAQYFREMIQYLRSIGIKVPICGTNLIFATAQLLPAQETDFVNNHFYWAHPDFSKKTYNFPVESVLSSPVWESTLQNVILANSSLKGFPVMHSEWNFCYPNPRRCEAIPLTAAYAAYQDWDGMIFYGATGSCDDGKWNRFLENPGVMIHSQQTDPATWGMSQVGAAMFRRGDVATAGRELEIRLPEESIFQSNLFPFYKMPFLPDLGRAVMSFSKDGTSNALGEVAFQKITKKERYLATLKLLGNKDSDLQKSVSDTKEIIRFSKPALLVVNTPRTQSVTGELDAIGKNTAELADFKIHTPMKWGSFNAVSRDGLPLTESKRVLLTAVSKAANTGEKLDAGQILNMGKAPVLIEPFVAEVLWKNRSDGVKVFELDPLTGKRNRELAVQEQPEGVRFKFDGTASSIYYEIIAK